MLRPLLVAVLLALPSAAQVLVPIEFTIVEQQASMQDCGAAASASGTSELSLPFSASCTHIGAVNGTLTTSNADGRLGITVTGVFTPSDQNAWQLPGLELRGRMTFVVPGTAGPGAMIDVFTVATASASATPGLRNAELGISHDLDSPSSAVSAILGTGYKPLTFHYTGTSQGSNFSVPQLRETGQLRLLAGDTVTLPFASRIGIGAVAAGPQSFSESVTYELKYLPEPSASLPVGFAALALLAHLRAPR